MLIDSHAHLGMSQFDKDRREVVGRALEGGIQFIFTVGTDVASSRQAVALSHDHPSVHAVVGIHPHNTKDIDRESLRQMRQIARDSNVRAYGEIGLDFFRNLSPPEIQITMFRKQIRLAKDLGLPVVIHDREADREMLNILQEEGGGEDSLQAVIHCFSGDLIMAEQCLEKGFYLSVPGTVTFPKAQLLKEVVRQIPLERFMIETDCPFLAPEPFRGRRNEPAYVRYTAEAIAHIKGLSLKEVAEATSRTALKFFRMEDAS
ncbi:MAG: YchF/TatD family DNA exonuclease [Proteobacteria bacterium]|nr:YchF/TatD family DNA exonuclease [Pseudomonadota bacterium]